MQSDDGRRTGARILLEDGDEGLDAARRRTDRDRTSVGYVVRQRLARLGGSAHKGARPRCRCHLHLRGEVAERVPVLGRRLRHAVQGADLEGPDCSVGAPAGQGGDHDHRHRPKPHDLLEECEAVHFRHLDVERDNVGIERLDGLAGFQWVGRFAHDGDGWVAAERGGDHAAHGGGVVDHENSHRLHLRAPPRSR